MNEIEPVSAYIFDGSMERNADPFDPLTRHKLSRAFPDNIHCFTVGSLERIQSILEKQAKLKEIGILILYAHGDPKEMIFGSSYVFGHLNTRNVSLYKPIFDRVHPTKGVVILRSCCKGDENHLAKKIHELYGIKVCATEKSFAYTGYNFLIRNLEGEFENHSFDLSGNDVSAIYENGKKKTFKDQSKQILELVQLQGYQYYKFPSGKFAQYLIENSKDAYYVAIEAWNCWWHGDHKNEFRLYREAVERACNNSETEEIIKILQLLSGPWLSFTAIQKERSLILAESRQKLMDKLRELPDLKAKQYLIENDNRNKQKINEYKEQYRKLIPLVHKDGFLIKLNKLLKSIDSKPEQEIQEAINRCEKKHAELDQLNPKTIEIIELQEALQSRKEKLQSALDLKSQSKVA